MPVPVTPPQDVSPATGRWVEKNLESHLAHEDHDPRVGCFEIRNTTSDWQPHAGVRALDSSLETDTYTWANTSHFRYAPIRERRVELYRDPGIEIFFHGYVEARRGGAYHEPKRLPVNEYESWYRLDMNRHTSTDRTPRLVFVRFTRPDQWGYRTAGLKHPNQSVDVGGRIWDMVHGAVAPCDENGNVDLWIQNEDVLPYIVGWVDDRASVTMHDSSLGPSVADQWQVANVGSLTETEDAIAWLVQGSLDPYAENEDRHRVGARTPGVSQDHYLHAAFLQWRPVQLSGGEFEHRIENTAAGETRLLASTPVMDLDRDDDGTPSDPSDDPSPVGFITGVRREYDDDGEDTGRMEKVMLPVFDPDHVDGSMWRVGLADSDEVANPEAHIGAFALAPRDRAAWPQFTIWTDDGPYAIHDLDLPPADLQPPEAPQIETLEATAVGTESMTLNADVTDMGSADEVDVQFRIRKQ